MTAFLWHLTAMLGVYGAMLGLGRALPVPATGGWWAQVPLRFLAAGLLTALLVAAFRRFEAPSRPPRRPARAARWRRSGSRSRSSASWASP